MVTTRSFMEPLKEPFLEPQVIKDTMFYTTWIPRKFRLTSCRKMQIFIYETEFADFSRTFFTHDLEFCGSCHVLTL